MSHTSQDLTETPGRARIVEVSAPSRLHFGMFAIRGERRRFGGVGAMIDAPRTRVRVSPAAELVVGGAQRDRALEFVRRWHTFHCLPQAACCLEVADAPQSHRGLGSGTQLGLAIAAALASWTGRCVASAAELALSVGRGARSAVGLYGFTHGGLIVERGKSPNEPVSPLDVRVTIPEAWRFVLIEPGEPEGLWGRDEERAFESLPNPEQAQVDRLTSEVRDTLLPALLQEDFPAFSASLHRFGLQAGLAFARRQGGAFNGPTLTRLVELVRQLGVEGVGQSSWGPTLFALLPTERDATDFAQRLVERARCQTLVARPDNHGAQVTTR